MARVDRTARRTKRQAKRLEAIWREAVFRLKDNENKLPKDVGYNDKLEARYLQAYEDLDADKINKEQALEILTKTMKDYYGFKYSLK